jgi:acetyltransferase-like isoleucine patch superfamily enzyme
MKRSLSLERLATRCSGLLHLRKLRRTGVRVGPNTALLGKPIVSCFEDSSISIGADCFLISRSTWTALGVSHPVIIRTLAQGAEVTIGNECGLSGVTICAAINVSIGNRCLLGADVLIADTDFHSVDTVQRRHLPTPAPSPSDSVRIGNDVFVGARAIILKGVTVGDGSVVGAGSVVTEDIPSGVIAAGNPARVIRPLGKVASNQNDRYVT